jgi:hypothetical protein
MRRILVPILLAASVGALASWLATVHIVPGFEGRIAKHAASDPGARTASRPSSAGPGTVDRPPTVSEFQTVYDRAASAGLREVDARLVELGAVPRGPRERLEAHALLTRYAELDPAAALRRARELRLEVVLQVPVLQVWWVVDEPAALAALAAIEDRAEARVLASGLIRGAGADQSFVDRVLAVLPEPDRDRVRADRIVAMTGTSPEDALRQALAFDSQESRYRTVQNVGAVWASSDPQGAFAAAASIRELALRSAYQRMVLRTWAMSDPETMLSRFATLDGTSQQQLLDVLGFERTLDVLEPMRMIEFANVLAYPAARRLRRLGLQRLAERDPLDAIAVADRLAASTAERNELYSAIAAGYARVDPTGAVHWARRVGAPGLMTTVLSGVAQIDIHAALDHALALDDDRQRIESFHHVIHHALANAAEPVQDHIRIAARLLAMDDTEFRSSALSSLVSIWGMIDARAAFGWMTSTADRIDPALFGSLAQPLAARDLTLAISSIDRVPDAARDTWAGNVATRYAQLDPDGATAWALSRRGQPGYEAALRAVVDHAGGRRIHALASAVADLDGASPHAAAAVSNLLYLLMQEHAAEGAAWVSTIRDQMLQATAASRVAGEWHSKDPAAAAGWVLGLPAGPVRDAALASIGSADGR